MRVRVVVFVAALAVVLALPALACSICGCDPAAGTLGLDRPSASSLRLAIEDRYLAKESGTGGEAESEREDRLLLRAQYSPLRPLVLQVEVPYFIFKNHLNSAGVRDDSATGLGDVTFGARYELLRVGLGREPDADDHRQRLAGGRPPGREARLVPGGVADDADPVASTESPRSPFGCRESNLICLVINICNFNRQPLQDNGFGSTSFTGTSFTIRLGAGFEHRRRR